jgi:hypothetical protein
MTLQELLDMPPEEFRQLAIATLEANKPEGGLYRLKGMADFLCAIHQLQRKGWKRAPRSMTMRITGQEDRTNRLYATWQRRSGTINRTGGGFKHKPLLPPKPCRSYSLVPDKFSALYEALSAGVDPNDINQPIVGNPQNECAIPAGRVE